MGAMRVVMSLVSGSLVSSSSLSTRSQVEGAGRGRGSLDTREHSVEEW